MTKDADSQNQVRFFNVSLINANIMSAPRFPQPQQLIGELIQSLQAASPRFAWVQFLFRRVNYSASLVALKNAMNFAAEQIKTPKTSLIDDSEYDRAELHRDWHKRSGERIKRIDSLVNVPHVLLAIQGMWVGDPRLLSTLPFKDCYDEHDRLGIFTYRNPSMLVELVERRMVEDISSYIASYAYSRLEPPSFLITPDQMPYYVHMPIVKEAESAKSVIFKQYSPATRDGGVEGEEEEESALPSKVLKLSAVPLITEPLKEKDTLRLSLLPSPTVRTFEITFAGGKTGFFISSRSESDAKEYVAIMESVYGELDAKEAPAKPSFLGGLPRIIGIS